MANDNLTTLRTPVDLTRQQEQRLSEERFAMRREQELDDIAWLMSEHRGRRLMFRLLSMSNVFSSSFTGNSETFFNEGRRVIGTTLMKDIVDAGLEELELRMKIEHRDQKRKEESKDG